MAQGKFISIEGTEGAGKSTALHFIKQYLNNANIEAIWTREPGGTELAEEIRNLILHSKIPEKIEPDTELLMMFAGRSQHIKTKILPALQAGKWVVTDRFIDASYAYQGGGRGMDIDRIRMLDEWIVGKHYPDLTLLLDISPEQGFERTKKRAGGKDRIEQEKLDFFVRVRETYLQRAKQDPDRIKVIDASLELSEVERQIGDVLGKFK
jgi:dTMP kinase